VAANLITSEREWDDYVVSISVVSEKDTVMKNTRTDPDMLEEYDFSGGIRGKYAERYAEGTNVVVIDPDVAEFFPDQETVNQALRGLAEIIKRHRKADPVR